MQPIFPDPNTNHPTHPSNVEKLFANMQGLGPLPGTLDSATEVTKAANTVVRGVGIAWALMVVFTTAVSVLGLGAAVLVVLGLLRVFGVI
jgi:hypothetical protein